MPFRMSERGRWSSLPTPTSRTTHRTPMRSPSASSTDPRFVQRVVACSVVIPSYNAESSLGACLEALEHQTVPRNTYEIIVVDDGSTD
ncbi:MAG: glycosyltransferase, partial [Candidatus Methylomirabilia bacterium]